MKIFYNDLFTYFYLKIEITGRKVLNTTKKKIVSEFVMLQEYILSTKKKFNKKY